MSNTKEKIAKLRLAEMGVGVEEPTKSRRTVIAPVYGEDEPVVSVARKGDNLTEETIGKVAYEVRDAFLDAADGAGFELRNDFSSEMLHEMVVWLMRMHFVKGGE